MQNKFTPEGRFDAMRSADLRLVVTPTTDKWGLNDTVLTYSVSNRYDSRKKGNDRLSEERYHEVNRFRICPTPPKESAYRPNSRNSIVVGESMKVAGKTVHDFHFLRRFVEEAELNVNNVLGVFNAAAHSGTSVEDILAWLSDELTTNLAGTYTVQHHLGLNGKRDYHVPVLIFNTGSGDDSSSTKFPVPTYVLYLDYSSNQVSVSIAQIEEKSVIFKTGSFSTDRSYSEPVPFVEMCDVAAERQQKALDERMAAARAYATSREDKYGAYAEEQAEKLQNTFGLLFNRF